MRLKKTTRNTRKGPLYDSKIVLKTLEIKTIHYDIRPAHISELVSSKQ